MLKYDSTIRTNEEWEFYRHLLDRLMNAANMLQSTGSLECYYRVADLLVQYADPARLKKDEFMILKYHKRYTETYKMSKKRKTNLLLVQQALPEYSEFDSTDPVRDNVVQQACFTSLSEWLIEDHYQRPPDILEPLKFMCLAITILISRRSILRPEVEAVD